MSLEITERSLKMRKVVLLSALFFCALALFVSCKKTGELTPANTVGDLNATYTDTITVASATFVDDSNRTDETSRNLLGVFNDPVFGITKASFYSQLILSSTSLEFPPGAILDSVVLKLAYDNYYGRTGQQLSLRVHELTEALDSEEDYFNYSTVAFDPSLLGSRNMVPDLTDTISNDSVDFVPTVSILLDKAFGDKIFNHGPFTNNDEFINFFKGFHIQPDTASLPSSGDGAIVYFNLLNDASAMVMYYHFQGEGGETQTGEYEFVVNTGTARFSHFSHDYTGTDIASGMGQYDQQLSYVQPMSGVKTRVEFPYLTNLTRERNIAINKAELLITVAEGTNDEFAVPDRLIVLSKNDDGNNVFIPDFFEGTDYFGGKLDINSGTYRFNIARYIDQLANEKVTSKGLYIVISGSSVSANRLVLNSGRHPTTQLKLRLTYTQL